MESSRSSGSESTADSGSTTTTAKGDVEGGMEGVHVRGGMKRFEMISPEERVLIMIDRVSTYVPEMFGQPNVWRTMNPTNVLQWWKTGTSKAEKKMKQILCDVSGCVRPGEVLALMGPSGSGKTTLLSILGGRAQKSMKVKGRVRFNGEPLEKNVKRKIGYVMQDDLLYESLTVYETLYYAAMLRLPKSMSVETKKKRIDGVIEALGLQKASQTIVGGFFRRGISGGERKRASVGHELLINPSVLFLDEPTSGLDSTTAMQLIETLRELAHGGRSIVTTIHQPSSRLYQHLDKLLLLSDGHVMYYGNAQHAVDYFEKLGFDLPPRMNAADFILDLASGQVATKGKSEKESTQYLVDCMEVFLEENADTGFDLDKNSDNGLLDDIVDGVKKGKLLKSSTKTAAKQKTFRSFRRYESLVGGADMGDRWGASYWAQVKILFQRNLKTRRFESVSTQDVLMFTVIALLAGSFWFQRGKDDSLAAARDVVGVIFFMLMFLCFRSMFVSLFTFPAEQRHMLKERASGMYRLSAFYVARSFADFPTDMSIPSGLIVVVYFMAGLKSTWGAFWGTYGTLLLSMFVAQSYGLLLGSYFMNPKTSQAVAAVIMLSFILTGGFFVLNIPSWIAWFKYLSFVYYALGLALYVQFDAGSKEVYVCYEKSGNNYTCDTVELDNPSTNEACEQVTKYDHGFCYVIVL